MRIIIIHNFYKKAGGEDVVFAQETELLRENGHEVECIVFNNKIVHSPFKSLIYFFRSIYNFRSARIVEERIKSFQPDLIHIHNTYLVASPSIYSAARKMGVPVVQTLHNYRLICPSTSLYYKDHIYTKSINKLFPIDAIVKGVYRNSIAQTLMVVLISAIHKILGSYRKKVARFIALSEHSKALFLKSSLKLNDSQIVVKPNFLNDPGRVETKRDDYFIYVGRLEPEKGVKTLLKAFASTKKQILIIGDGTLKSLVMQYAGDNQNIEYLGFLERGDILNRIRKAKALIFPSEWYETFGLTIIEAFACSTPVIISDLGGHSKMVEEGKTGFHFKSGSSNDLILALNKFDDITDKAELGKNARNAFELNYTAEINYQKLISIYKSLLN